MGGSNPRDVDVDGSDGSTTKDDRPRDDLGTSLIAADDIQFVGARIPFGVLFQGAVVLFRTAERLADGVRAKREFRCRLIPGVDSHFLSAFRPEYVKNPLRPRDPYPSASLAETATMRALQPLLSFHAITPLQLPNGTAPVHAHIISFGSSLATPKCRTQLGVSVEKHGIPLTFERDPSAVDKQATRMAKGFPRSEEVWRIAGTNGFERWTYPLELDDGGAIIRDYWMMSYLPNGLSMGNGFVHLNQGGLTGIGTRLTYSFLRSPALVKKVVKCLDGRRYFQIVISTGVRPVRERTTRKVVDHEPDPETMKLEVVFGARTPQGNLKWDLCYPIHSPSRSARKS